VQVSFDYDAKIVSKHNNAIFCHQSRFIDLKFDGKEESLEKHRFLVQSKAISEADLSKISAMSAASRNEEVILNIFSVAVL